MTRQQCVRILRNPYEHSQEKQREAALFLCDEIECLERLIEELRCRFFEQAETT